ncbi:MAG: Wzz/FepE/Etk N-terminal domain-containing protein [Bacteroidaceae bacterium]|nr:Wzz/FepE/Etk N-terminal domain-containing protein [Bacteroidaceae bacterium]
MDNKEYIDLRAIISRIWNRKWKIALTMCVTAILSYLFTLLFPRYYRSEVVLAPESEMVSAGGTMSALAASFGIDFGAVQTSDAIYPMLYPDLFNSNDFIVRLFDIKIETIDGTLSTDYYSFLKKYRKKTFWSPWVSKVKKFLKPKSKVGRNISGDGESGVDPFMLSEEQNGIAELVRNSVTCFVDKKTDVITIQVEEQDPLVCAILADSIRQRLQTFIIEYRTRKSKADCAYFQTLTDNARDEYHEALKKYSEFCDTHKNVVLQSVISEMTNLENEAQIRFSTYSAMNTQFQAARAKVQECTPVFTILQNASVPVKPSSPKRLVFSFFMMIMSLFVSLVWIFKDDLKESIFYKS